MTNFNYEIIYKKRKSIGIQIDYYGRVQFVVPKGTEDEVIQKVIEEKGQWIEEKVLEMKKRLEGDQEKVYENGEGFMYLGSLFPIFINNNHEDKDSVNFINNEIHVYVKENDEESIKKALKRFYYKECKSLVEKRIRLYQKEFKVKPKSVSISDSVANWGTCNSKLELTFNWKLAMAPVEVIDYVVVHEMCHMVHLNHDRSFWRLVGKILPDYEQRSNWLALSKWKMQI